MNPQAEDDAQRNQRVLRRHIANRIHPTLAARYFPQIRDQFVRYLENQIDNLNGGGEHHDAEHTDNIRQLIDSIEACTSKGQIEMSMVVYFGTDERALEYADELERASNRVVQPHLHQYHTDNARFLQMTYDPHWIEIIRKP